MSEGAAGSPAGWADRVDFSEETGGFAYRPGEVLVGGEHGLETAKRLFPALGPEVEVFAGRETGQFYRLYGDLDPLEIVHGLRVEGAVAQPNHVLFAHGDCCCGPHPALRWATGLQGSPLSASPFYASPFYASPFYASPSTRPRSTRLAVLRLAVLRLPLLRQRAPGHRPAPEQRPSC